MEQATIRVVLPYHLRNLARVEGEQEVPLSSPFTIGRLLAAVESRFPVLVGAIREHGTLKRRAFVRYYACREDLSHEMPDFPLPEQVVAGIEPFFIVGAMAGG